jgi:sodium transport system ATP-binding protein
MDSLIQVTHLTKKFRECTAVNDVSFSAHAGEIFGLLGPNGAGKTTTLRTLATVLAPSSGTARICGFDIIEQPQEARKHVGMLTTEIGVYERFSGRENLRYFGQLYGLFGEELEHRIEELSTLLAMQEFLDKRAGKYSTGMKQKLAIARSVIHNPDVIIFDEPTAGLDVLASQTVIRFMKRARERGKLVVLSTHEMVDAEKLCDRVAIMHQGKIIAIDTVDRVKQQTGAYDLEEAFVALVHGDGSATWQERPEKKRLRTISPMAIVLSLRVATILLVIIGFLGNMQGWFPVGIGYGMIVLGILTSMFAKRLQKKRALT